MIISVAIWGMSFKHIPRLFLLPEVPKIASHIYNAGKTHALVASMGTPTPERGHEGLSRDILVTISWSMTSIVVTWLTGR